MIRHNNLNIINEISKCNRENADIRRPKCNKTDIWCEPKSYILGRLLGQGSWNLVYTIYDIDKLGTGI